MIPLRLQRRRQQAVLDGEDIRVQVNVFDLVANRHRKGNGQSGSPSLSNEKSRHKIDESLPARTT